MSIEHLKVLPEQLTVVCDPADLGFETTDEIAPAESPIGQERAVSAMELGLDIEQKAGFNMLVSGRLGSDRNQALKSIIDRIADTKPKAADLGYVYNFSDSSQPQAIMLPGGMVSELRTDMDDTIETCRREVSRLFEREDYAESIDRVKNDFLARHKAIDDELQTAFCAAGLTLEFSEAGPTFPAMRDGRKMTSEELESLPEEKRVRLTKDRCHSEQLLTRWQVEKRKLHEEETAKVGSIDHGVVSYTITPMIEALLEKYCDTSGTQFSEAMRIYLEGVQADIIENAGEFKSQDDEHWGRYKVNVLVNNLNSEHAPVIFDYSPTYHNLFGRIDHKYPNAPTDDFMLIKPGSLHRANGGYLVLQARDLRNSPWSWDTLKRILRSRQLQIENIAEKDAPLPSSTIRPETIPINIKVIVVATYDDLGALRGSDEEFDSYFKVMAQFDWRMARTPENIQKYASFVSATVQSSGLHPFDKTAVARLVDYSSRLAERQDKLTTIFQDIADVITEANYWAAARKHGTVTREDVVKTIEQRKYRASLWKDVYQEQIEGGSVHIDTEGSKVGQINGIGVFGGSDEHSFGLPARTTAKAYLGRGQLINVEREAKMTRPTYDKGFMVLKGYLNGKYGQDQPLSLSASISFEQEHSPITGDSASSTELYALLSELSGLPITQGIAVTGAVNQNGDVQFIGGATHKIEGFFDLCEARGLNGTQGFIIPKDNVKDLVLKDEVVQAVRDGLFQVYGVSTIDEGIEVLTGVTAGQAGEDDHYPKGSVHQLVEKRLQGMARMARDWENEKDEEAKTSEDESA